MVQSIPASQIVSVTPGVVGAGGSALQLIGLMLSKDTRTPIGQVLSFPTAAAVAAYYGASSDKAALATNYFNGFDNSDQKPGALLIAQYPATAVAAYLRGGNISGLTLAQLQAITPGTLTVVIDGYSHTSSSINLSSATSFSNAASIIQTALNASEPTEATCTASIGATFTGTGTGTSLVVTGITGILSPGDVIAGTGVPAGTTIISGPSNGGNGTYITSGATTASSASLTSTSKVMDVTVLGTGTLAVGQTITGSGITGSPVITSLITGAGGTGTYGISVGQTVASEAITATATAPTVTYDSVSGAFIITSGITGTPSMAAFATGAMAAPLLLTQATGAVLSQGAAATTPAAFMAGIVNQTQDFVSFMTVFDPDNGSGNTQKLAFATWNNGQLNRFDYVCWDTDVTPTQSTNAAGSLGQLIKAASISGTELIWSPTQGAALAAFQMGSIASLDTDETNGRATMDFRSQAGLTADVTDATTYSNLIANGYNGYCSFATANEQFTFFSNGSISGPYLWVDSYIDAIWLNNALQLAILSLLIAVKRIPYNTAGYELVQAACLDPITAALNFGAITAGVPLSAAQAAEVNNAAGVQIDGVLSTRGWYLQILPATAQVRAARGSPPCTLWYTDGQAIQKINLTSLVVE